VRKISKGFGQKRGMNGLTYMGKMGVWMEGVVGPHSFLKRKKKNKKSYGGWGLRKTGKKEVSENRRLPTTS